MSADALDGAVRDAGRRVVAALAARYRDLDIAEEAFAEACARAAAGWTVDGAPRNPAGWLYKTADRAALDMLRRRRTAQSFVATVQPEPLAESDWDGDDGIIPDERLRLIFVCCHPAVAPDARAALTLRLVCGLSTLEIARAFLIPETTLAQRLVRAKRKIADAGVPFAIPGPEAWPDRLEAVLATLEIAYAKAYEDAAGVGTHAGFASETLYLTGSLAALLPEEAEVLALAALARYAEARRPARVDAGGMMVPLSDQDPRLWHRALIEDGDRFLTRAAGCAQRPGARLLQAAIHATWCMRTNLDQPAPWTTVLSLYDALLTRRDDPVVRLNRVVAVAEVAGPTAALDQLYALDAGTLCNFLPYQAVRAELLRRAKRPEEARAAYTAALSLAPPNAERLWLNHQLDALSRAD